MAIKLSYMKMIINAIASLTILILSSNCRYSNIEQKDKVKGEIANIDTMRRYIPLSKQTTSYKNLKNTIEKLIGLESLENGVNADEIRVWFANASSREQLVVLKNVSEKWTAEIYLLGYNYDTATNKLLSINKDVQSKIPISGWELFINNLFTLDISKLPDMEQLDNYQIGFDGRTITIEVANKNSYRIYSYWSPETYQDKIPESKKVVLISKLLEHELGFKPL